MKSQNGQEARGICVGGSGKKLFPVLIYWRSSNNSCLVLNAASNTFTAVEIFSLSSERLVYLSWPKREASGNNDVHYMHLDLASLQSVREFAEEVCGKLQNESKRRKYRRPLEAAMLFLGFIVHTPHVTTYSRCNPNIQLYTLWFATLASGCQWTSKQKQRMVLRWISKCAWNVLSLALGACRGEPSWPLPSYISSSWQIGDICP